MPKPEKQVRPLITTEAAAYLEGLFREFRQQTAKYHQLTGHLLSVEAQIELAEKMLCLTRDHLAMTIEKTQCSGPNDSAQLLHSVRFVGVRLADACKALLQEHRKLTPEELVSGLNSGMFRFRTNSPLREIHAALLKQSFVRKVGSAYTWVGTSEQMPLRMRVLKTQVVDQAPAKEGTTDSSK